MFRCNHFLCTVFFTAGAAIAVSALIPSAWVRLAVGMFCAGIGLLCKRP